MQITIPDDAIPYELIDRVSDLVVEAAYRKLDDRFKHLEQCLSLPEYANKSQVRKILGIGDATLTDWINRGLKFQDWGKQQIIERSVLKEFLKSMEV